MGGAKDRKTTHRRVHTVYKWNRRTYRSSRGCCRAIQVALSAFRSAISHVSYHTSLNIFWNRLPNIFRCIVTVLLLPELGSPPRRVQCLRHDLCLKTAKRAKHGQSPHTSRPKSGHRATLVSQCKETRLTKKSDRPWGLCWNAHLFSAIRAMKRNNQPYKWSITILLCRGNYF